MFDLEPGGTRTSHRTQRLLRIGWRFLQGMGYLILAALGFGLCRYFTDWPSLRFFAFPLGAALACLGVSSVMVASAFFGENLDRRGGLEAQFVYWSKGQQLGANYWLSQLANLLHLLLGGLMVAGGIGMIVAGFVAP